MFLPWLLCALLAAAVLALCAKLWLLHKSMDALCEQLKERLAADTNTLLCLPCRDRQLRRLACELNAQLRLLRAQRRRYLNGDRELKEAVTNISHDLRTPLTAICGYLELLEAQDTSPDAARYLACIRERAGAMKQLTEELFRYSVIASCGRQLGREPVELNRALEESLAAFYLPLKQRGIAPVVHMPAAPVVRPLDAAALSRVFGNILSNVLKYSAGDLDILLRENGEIVFSNTAPALSEVQVGKLFDRFFSVETARNSTGLGLSIARALMEEMGGSVTAGYAVGRLSLHLAFREGPPGTAQ